MIKGQPNEEGSAKERPRSLSTGSRVRTSNAPTPFAERYVWDPRAWSRELDRSFEEMRRNMESLISPWWSPGLPRATGEPAGAALPRADLLDEGEAFTATIEVPGCTREQVELEVAGDRLEMVARSEHREEREARDEDFLARERSYRELRRSFTFPERVLPEKVSADLKNGVLTVRAPKERPAPAPQRVRVKVS